MRPYPDVNSGHWQVSTGGGTRPLWSRTGQELFYVSPAGAIMRVAWSGGIVGRDDAETVVKEGYVTVRRLSRPKLRRLARRTTVPGAQAGERDRAPPQIVVVQHFDEELKRLVPTK